MLRNGLTFGMEGPNMEGTWYNPQTGDSFTVRNSFFEDNQYIVQTTDGRILGYNQIQNYIKSDNPTEIQESSFKKQTTELPPEVADLVSDDYNDEVAELLAAKPLGNLAQPTSALNTSNVPPTQQSMDVMVIEKALNKCQLPDLQVGIEWDNFPITEAKFLVNVMDMTVEDIVTYYLNKVDVVTTTAMIHEVLRSHIESQLFEPEKEIELTDECTTPEPVESKKGSTSKKISSQKSQKTTKVSKDKSKTKVNE